MDARLVLALALFLPTTSGAELQAQNPVVTVLAAQERPRSVPLREVVGEPLLSGSVTVRRANAPLEQVLREIARQAGLGISFGEELPRSDTRVSVDIAGLRASDALDRAVRGTPWTVRYTESGQLLVMRRPPTLLGAVVGKVTAAGSGQPIAAVTLVVQGTQLGGTTDALGDFRIAGVPAGTRAVLARRIGYIAATRTVTVVDGETASLDITLEPSPSALQAVVVTGTAGNQTRAAQGAVIATIDATALVSKAPVTSVSDLLTSRTPGITITQGSGTLGAASRINIRGASSISLSNEPLVFIDGVRMQSGQRNMIALGGQTISALNDLNPNDIESIEVVKGPAAATLYGADASAGVIQIITRKGRLGANRFTQSVTAKYDRIEPNFTPSPIYGVCSAALVGPTSASTFCRGQPEGTIVSDNYLERTGAFSNASVGSIGYSGQGGGDNYSFFVSAAADDETGTTANTSLRRRNGRANVRWLASEKLTVDATFGISRNDYRLPKGDQDTYGYLIAQSLASPTTVRTAADGSLVGGTTQTNEAISSILNEIDALRTTPTVQLQYSPVGWFSNRLTVGADITTTRATQFFPRNGQNWYPSAATGANAGAVSVTQDHLNIYTVDYLGNIRTSFGEGKRLVSDFSFGSQYINTTDNALSGSGTTIVTNASNLVGSTAQPVGGQGYSQQKSLGLLVQEQLGFDDKLFLQFGARLDRNSAFGRDADAFFLPKVGLSYVLSEESFWDGLSSAVPTLRFRAAYGTTGRSPSPTAGLRTYSPARYLSPTGAVLIGVVPGSPGNPALEPERGKELEAGIDASFLNDRASVELTYYNKRTSDLLLIAPISPSLGFGASGPFTNLGAVDNRGLEFVIRGTPISRENVVLEASFDGSTLRNEVTSLGNLNPLVNTNRVVTAGLPLGAWYGPRVKSVDVAAGTVIVSDTSEYIGDQLPTFQANFSTTLTLFNRVRLYALVDRKSGHSIQNFGQMFRDRYFLNSAESVLPEERGGYSPEERLRYLGQPNGRYTTTTGRQVSAASVAEPYIEDASFTRLREVSATIDLPAGLAQAFRASSASITVAGRNLHLWTDFRGSDPEVLGTGPGSGGTLFTQFYNVELFTLPPTRRWSARVNVQF